MNKKLIKEFFTENSEEITNRNWINLKNLSLVYLGSLVIYYLFCCGRGYFLHNAALISAFIIQALYCIIVNFVKSTPKKSVVDGFLTFFGFSILALSAFLGAFVFKHDSALLFPLMIIMMTQFYTVNPNYIMIKISIFCIIFLILSFINKPADVFVLDLISNVVAVVISAIAVSTLTKYKIENYLKQKELDYLCKYDRLTGVLNKLGFDSEYEKRVNSGAISGKFALAMMDLDSFKSINDKYGHIAGDDVLESFAKVLSDSFGSDNIGRFGGDEFLVLINNTENIEELLDNCMANVEALKEKFGFPIKCCAGVVICENTFDKLRELINAADIQLYNAKKISDVSYKIA